MTNNDLKYDILNLVCEFTKNTKQVVTPHKVKTDLFPELGLDLIRDIFDELLECNAVNSVKGREIYLSYRVGLEDFIENRGFEPIKTTPVFIDNSQNITGKNINVISHSSLDNSGNILSKKPATKKYQTIKWIGWSIMVIASIFSVLKILDII
jgi:hypothetical protein